MASSNLTTQIEAFTKIMGSRAPCRNRAQTNVEEKTTQQRGTAFQRTKQADEIAPGAVTKGTALISLLNVR